MEILLQMYGTPNEYGSTLTDHVEQITGRLPRTFAQWQPNMPTCTSRRGPMTGHPFRFGIALSAAADRRAWKESATRPKTSDSTSPSSTTSASPPHPPSPRSR
ncbi:hypothetical protein [Nonomuraea turcica]|uniref:hypothetical protein n=1 Tax=Nonomuraea sp. G32 TaxID=3067274 RepID=UPI00273BF19E|nr:hypothetical protein [Nonomuraea sp. G32]MDP4505328.1 hypothetical protein [Nonomuraea sp. G32]